MCQPILSPLQLARLNRPHRPVYPRVRQRGRDALRLCPERLLRPPMRGLRDGEACQRQRQQADPDYCATRRLPPLPLRVTVFVTDHVLIGNAAPPADNSHHQLSPVVVLIHGSV